MKVTRIPCERERRPLRVAAYCRVSTELTGQEESFAAQQRHYRERIAAHKEWVYAGVYSDEKSALQAENRAGFQRLVRDALAGRVDCILVKSVSRFSRNLVDCQRYAALLADSGVYIRFEREGLDTADPSCSMMFAFLSVIAQDESRAISDNVRWSYQERFRRGICSLGSNRVFGYDSVEGRLAPNEMAGAVREIFRRYVGGETCGEIARALARQGVKGRLQRPLTPGGVRYILANETYVGDRRLQKQPPAPFLGERSASGTVHTSYYFKNRHEAVIDRPTWEAAQSRRAGEAALRAAGVRPNGSRSHFLFGRVFCASCGAPMTRRTLRCSSRPDNRTTYKAWTCRQRHLGRWGNGCQNPTVRESALLATLETAIGCEDNVSFSPERCLREVARVEAGERIRVILTEESANEPNGGQVSVPE